MGKSNTYLYDFEKVDKIYQNLQKEFLDQGHPRKIAVEESIKILLKKFEFSSSESFRKWHSNGRQRQRDNQYQNAMFLDVGKFSAKKTSPNLKFDSVLKLYYNWCVTKSFIASDIELSYFSGFSASTFKAARIALQKQGFKFRQEHFGYTVIERPKCEEEIHSYLAHNNRGNKNKTEFQKTVIDISNGKIEIKGRV